MSDGFPDTIGGIIGFFIFGIIIIVGAVIYGACLLIYLLLYSIYFIINYYVSLITAYINELISNISAHISSHPYLFMIIASLLLLGLGFFLASKYHYYIYKKDNEAQEQ